MDKPLLLLALPNSGSDWFAETLAGCDPSIRYYKKEFFNPVCNLKHEAVLRRNFGSELVSCYRNIALPGDEQIDNDIRATWGSEAYNFTKECQSPFKLPVFVRHFRCVVLVRRAPLPPSRARVWSFYEHAWFALREAGHAVTAESTIDRAYEAHALMLDRVTQDAAQLGVPTLDYDGLMYGDAAALAKQLAAAGLQAPGLSEKIETTRRRRPNSSGGAF